MEWCCTVWSVSLLWTEEKRKGGLFRLWCAALCRWSVCGPLAISLFRPTVHTHTHRSPNWTICPFRRNFKELIEFASQHTQWTSQPAPVHCVCVLRRRRPIMAAVCSLSHISLITRCDVRFPATNLQLDTLFLFIDLHFLPSENTTRPSFFFCWCPLISINKKPHF